MNNTPKSRDQEQQRIRWQLAQAAKKPYLVRDVPETVLYLTLAQAAKRFDLIPQFTAMPLGADS